MAEPTSSPNPASGAPPGRGAAPVRPSRSGLPARGGMGWLFGSAYHAAGRSRSRLLVIELAVLGATFTILFTLLLPAYRSSVGAARGTVCLGKLRRLHQMTAMYLQDNDGVFPPLPAEADLARATRPFVNEAEAWTLRLAPYREEKERSGDPYVCPVAPGDAPTYAYNAALGARIFPTYQARSTACAEAGVSTPSQTFLFFDTANQAPANALCGYRFFNGTPTQGALRPGDFVLPSASLTLDWQRPRHHDGANVVYCDGHARRIADLAVRFQARGPFDPTGAADAQSDPGRASAQEAVPEAGDAPRR